MERIKHMLKIDYQGADSRFPDTYQKQKKKVEVLEY